MSSNNPGGEHQPQHPQSQHPKSDEHTPHSRPDAGEQQRDDETSRGHGSDRAGGGGAGGGRKGRSSNPGNFANDPDRARKAGKKGGKA